MVQFCQITVHRKHSIRDDHSDATRCGLGQPCFQFCHVAMGIPQASGFAETDAVDQACMVQGIADNGVSFVEQAFEQTAVRIET